MIVARIKWSRIAVPEEKEFETEQEAKDYIASKETHPLFRWAEIDTKRQYSDAAARFEKKALITELTKDGLKKAGAMKFKVRFDKNGGAHIQGPSDYMASEQCKKLLDDLKNGNHTMFRFFPPGTPIATMVEVILQTNYAGYLGMKQLAVGMKFRGANAE
ncbi:hypothetical protein HY522_06080 [bacterium]|nr:hypothetical protein [bacterium]